jgi:arylsulfatase A-like enzyme
VLHSIDGSFAIRQGRWKLEMCPGSGGWSSPKAGKECEGLPTVQLYDVEQDVAERANLQQDHPEEVARLTALLTRYVKEGRSTPGPAQRNDGQQRWKQLGWMARDR